MKPRLLWLLGLCLAVVNQSSAQAWQPGKAKLMTAFSKDVEPDHVLAEYPRPQLVREDWMNLNGIWQYQPASDSVEALPLGKLSGSILVPFPVESALSGVMEHHESLWYQRTFKVPADWKGKDILLHFGAVDYISEVFVNGKSVGTHQGGYDPFTFDISPFIKAKGDQVVSVRVYDPTDKGGYPRGKQTLHPQGIMYTSVTGIWQTVWLEPVAKTSIDQIHMTPDIDASELKLTVATRGDQKGLTVAYKIKDGTQVVKTGTIHANELAGIKIADQKLWSPDHPFLYDIELSLLRGDRPLDKVSSYFGMRKIALGDEGGYKKLFLNNHFLFELGPLDQGFWPDGGYTAPTDKALKYDLETIKALGFNMVRKHIKVEPARWYYWADKLGVMVWQDMPSANSYTEHTPPVDTAAFRHELTRLVQTHWNAPSIVMWVIFNESQGQHQTKELVDMVKKEDPSRLVNQASGGGHFDAGDVFDIHSYPPPAAPENNHWQALACGEYGGIGYIIDGHTWKKGPTYIMKDNVKDYTNLYDEFARDLTVFKTNNGLSAAVYTEITDVEVELNGLMTYDRKVVKAPAETIRAANEGVIRDQIYLSELLPTSKDTARSWQYKLDKPTGNNWTLNGFDASSWKTGNAGFGTEGTPGGSIRTDWNTHDIWLRQRFTLNAAGKDKHDVVLYIHHDDNCDVYINGVKAASLEGATTGYSISTISAEAKNALKMDGENVMAIYCHQDGGGQYIDAGLSIMNTKASE